jgi:succinoglycan biosynthesis protein ExoA
MLAVSVIVPIRNEARSIERTLRALAEQDYPADKFEILVADGGSTDDTVPIVRQLQGEIANLRFFFNAGRLSSAARNLCVRHMAGDVCVIVDGHCDVADRQYVRKLAGAFAASGAECLGRPQPLTVPSPTPFQAAVAVARASRLGHNPDSDIYSDTPKFVNPESTAVAYRTDVFRRVGMFDEQFDACEDVEFNTRVRQAGLACYFSPAVKIVYHPRQNLRSLFVQLGRYGSGRARLAAKHPRSLSLPALVPPGWAIWLVLGGVAALLHPWIGAVYLASVALYLAVIVGGSLWLGRRLEPRVAIRLPAVFAGIHFGFAWGFLRQAGRLFMRV